MGISDHSGKPKTFLSDCLVTENQKSITKTAIFLFFSAKLRTNFSQYYVFINVYTLSPLNDVFSRFFSYEMR